MLKAKANWGLTLSVQTPPRFRGWGWTEGVGWVQDTREASFLPWSHGEDSAPHQPQRHSEGLAIATSWRTAVRGFPGCLCARGFLGPSAPDPGWRQLLSGNTGGSQNLCAVGQWRFPGQLERDHWYNHCACDLEILFPEALWRQS